MDSDVREPPEGREMGPLKVLLKGAGLTLLGLVFAKVAQYFFRLLVARQGAEEYGVFSLGLTVFSVAGMLSFLGLTNGLYRYLPDARARRSDGEIADYLKSVLHLVTISGAFLLVLLFLLSDWIAVGVFHDPRVGTVIRVLAFAVPLYAYTGIFLTVANSFYKNQYDMISKAVGESAARLALTAAALMLGYGLLGISAAYLLSIAVSFLLAFYFMEYKVFSFFRRKRTFSPKYGELLGFSVPLMLSGIVYLFINWTDTVALGMFKNVREVGIYNTALPTASLLTLLPVAFTTLFFPVVVELLAKKDAVALQRTHMTLNKWILMLNVPLFFLLLAYPDNVIGVLFGAEYSAASMPLQILAMGNFVYSILLSSTLLLGALDKPKWLLMNIAIAAVLNVLLNYMLVPPYGMAGAALGTAISTVLYCGICAYQVHRLRGLWPLPGKSIRIAIAGILSASGPYLLFRSIFRTQDALSLISVLVLSGAAYLALLLVFRTFEKTDFELLRALERKLRVRLPFLSYIIRHFGG